MFRRDFSLKFDFGTALHTKFTAFYITDDFAVTSDAQDTRALNRRCELSKNRKVVALHMNPDDCATFENDYITARLDSPPPFVVNFEILEANIATALEALAGLRVAHDFKNFTAMKAVY